MQDSAVYTLISKGYDAFISETAVETGLVARQKKSTITRCQPLYKWKYVAIQLMLVILITAVAL